jgi:hypothetical protein
MKSQYMQMKLFLAATEHSEIEKRFAAVPRKSAEFWRLFKRYDDLGEEIQSIYRRTRVLS